MDIIRRKSQPQQKQFLQPTKPSVIIKPFNSKEEFFVTHKTNFTSPPKQNTVHKKKNFRKNISLFLLIIALTLVCFLGFITWKALFISKKINIEKIPKTSFVTDLKSAASLIVPTEHKLLAGENEERINILMLGTAGEKDAGKNLTDTIMLMSIDTKNKKIALLSLPRDLYVQIPQTQSYTKINSIYSYGLKNDLGIEPLKNVVEKITGINPNYYIIANYEGFKQIINDIGGINVINERDIYDTRYPGPNYSYETFELKKGFHTLNGEIALKYVRERHDDPQGDFGRAKRQQQVMQAVKNKIFSAQTFLNVFKLNDILNTIGDNIKTNISLEELENFLALSKQLDTQNINSVVADAWKKDSLLKVSHVQIGPTRMFILVPRIGNYSEIQELASTIFSNDAIKKRQQQIADENATITIINRSGDNQLIAKIHTLLADKLNLSKIRIAASNVPIQEKTIIIDNTKGEKIYTLDELIKKLPASLQSEPLIEKIEQTDLVIVLGKDLIDTYKYEEDTMQDLQNADDSQIPSDILNN